MGGTQHWQTGNMTFHLMFKGDKRLIEYFNEDCMTGMSRYPDKHFDLVLTSPPYDDLRKYGGFKFDFEPIARELFRTIKRGGVLVWVVADAVHNGSESLTSFKQALYFSELGFNLHDTMIYAKTNPIPLTHNRYEQAFEFMFVFSKGRPKTFNPIMERTVTSGKYNQRRKTGRVAEAATRNRDEATIVQDNKYKTNIWEYVVGEKESFVKHPAVFPLQLAKDHISTWSNAGDIVLDPFSGSGTTGVACILLDRQFCGFEINSDYYKASKQRIEDLMRQPRLETLTQKEKKQMPMEAFFPCEGNDSDKLPFDI